MLETSFQSNKGSDVPLHAMLGGFSVTMAWRVLGLRMEERPPAIEGRCEYIE
jgi:hypothetical protein